MKEKVLPILTIGIIFKDEVRCLERCLKSLEPLRKAISCELIMADTGSNDGSHEIAARYADNLFDFPWKDDFSAARNAVMNQASGKWYLTIDADEYLDTDISELIKVLTSSQNRSVQVCSVIQRNYGYNEINGLYADCVVVRLLRMSAGLRYEGIIHERWPLTQKQIEQVYPLSKTILHHDGYAELDSERMQQKKKRNLKLLKETLIKEPKNMTVLLQYVESSRQEPDHPQIIRRALTAIDEKWIGWQFLGAPILRHAVRAAKDRNLPEFQKWITQAETQFPHSFFTQIDVEYIAFSYDWEQKDYASCIYRGEKCLKAFRSYRDGSGNQNELLYSSLIMSAPYWEQGLKIFVADAHLKEGNPARCMELLETLDGTIADGRQTENFIRVIRELHSISSENTSTILTHFWKEINQPIPDKKNAQERINAFHNAALLAFTTQSQIEEKRIKDFRRLSYTLFLPLEKDCEAGRGAAILISKDVSKIHEILKKVKNWNVFPAEVLSYALLQGISFPFIDHPLNIEEMDGLVSRMTSDKESFFTLFWYIAKQEFAGNLQNTVWLRAFVLAAIQIFPWDDNDENKINSGVDLAHLFGQIEKEFISNYYRMELLNEENICFLPPMHRFGWYCAQAFQALDNRHTTEYVQNLRAGLNSYPDGRAMIEYLTRHTQELQKEEISDELKVLAEQVRSILALYPPNAPEIKALKESPIYQKVAWLIEKI